MSQSTLDKKTVEVLKFLLGWNYLLTEPPIGGAISEIYLYLISISQSKGKEKISWIQFMDALKTINTVSGGYGLSFDHSNALNISYSSPFECYSRITDINRLSLALILKAIKKQGNNSKNNHNVVENFKEIKTPIITPKERVERYNMLMNLIDGPPTRIGNPTNDIFPSQTITNPRLIPKNINDIYTTTSRSRRFEQLEYLLSTPCSSHVLTRERTRRRTPIVPFYDCCEDFQHAELLIGITRFDKSSNYCELNKKKLEELIRQSNKRDKLNIDYVELSKCLLNKLHFIPIIQMQTDLTLGDCSYLDTCHKINTCRYIHYGQLMPQEQSLSKEDIKHNNEIDETMRVWDFTKGEPMSLHIHDLLPPQWINCDITKLDFSVLGDNFAVVLADPSWTIHMNLNYSSLEDDELLSLRMDKLQREGLFLLWVTGRTIETGRSFLKKWGYEVKNQVTWVKSNQLIRTISTGRTGHWLNHSKEHLLVGLKGNPKWLNSSMDPQILISSTRETSRKPDEIYGIIERLVGPRARKLEIFGRQHNTRPGWLTIGNQLKDTYLVEKEISSKLRKEQTIPEVS